MQKNKTLILWLAVIIFIAIVGYIGYNGFRNNLTVSSPGGEAAKNNDNGQTSLPDQSPLQKILGLIPRKNQPAEIKIYKNSEYEFEFTYPASFGDIIIKKNECPTGFMTIGSFTDNPNIDFGYVSSDYEKCNDNGFMLFETRSYDLLDKKLKLYSSDTSLPVVEVAIEQTIPTATPNIVAYVIKNTLEADGKGDAAAILRSPNPSIGALIFRTHGLSYVDGVKVLEGLIKN